MKNIYQSYDPYRPLGAKQRQRQPTSDVGRVLPCRQAREFRPLAVPSPPLGSTEF